VSAQRKRMIAETWHNAAFARQQRLPSLSSLLSRAGQSVGQSDAEMIARLDAWADKSEREKDGGGSG
jgi:hypothetical protein